MRTLAVIPSVKPKSFIARMLCMFCYPTLLLFGVITIILGMLFKVDFGVCNAVFLIWVIVFLALMERLIPYEVMWHPTRKEWYRDGIYLLLTMIGGGGAAMMVFYVASFISPIRSSLPLWLEIIVALLLSSLGSYVFHRVSHVHPWLWKLHGIHHVEGKVNVGNNGLNHVLDVFGRRLLAQLPIIFLGISQPALFVVAIFTTIQGYFVHANIDVNLGWFNYIIVSPEQHRLHHSKNLHEAGHFSVDISLWDILFKSFTWRPGRKPAEIGVVEPRKFPSPNNILESLLFPFIRKYKNQIT